MGSDPLQYIRDYYGVPAYKGVKVTIAWTACTDGKSGVITGADGPHILVKLDGQKHSNPYHPTDGVFYHIETHRVPTDNR